jgi:hypothetical protein
MVDSDEAFSTVEVEEFTEADGCTKWHEPEDTGPETAAKSAQSKSTKASNQPQAWLPSTIEVLSPMEWDASVLLKGIDYDHNLSARIIVATLRYKKEYLLKKSKNKGKNAPTLQIF